MLFNSYEFIFLFLPFSVFIYFFLCQIRLTIISKLWLLLASLFFYSWWNVTFLPLILISIFLNFALGVTIAGNNPVAVKSRKALLSAGIILNIGFLGYFKYAGFFVDNINLLFKTAIPAQQVLLPLAISFFTFQQITYLLDSYHGTIQEYNFLNYSIFVTFFPQLIAGPIVHHSEVMPQLESLRNKVKNYGNIAKGLFIFNIGLFKKVIIADTLRLWADKGFGTASDLNFWEGWITSLSYTFQIYFDFSGYTDMAIGAALLFNIKLPTNFNSPYKAANIRDFWRRWHITLTRFLRNYIYTPLGGNRCSESRIYTNVLITFLIGGFWHGAGWTFLF
jgi:D-alanyl-lipoteichoic acid acyltransferase DltB (MBOAT superfamily)